MSGIGHEEDDDKPCRACSDFRSWASKQKKNLGGPSKQSGSKAPEPPKDCPLDKPELGSATWGFLHSLASYFPKEPTQKQTSDIKRFFEIFGDFYPCEPCAIDFQEDIKTNPVKANTREELERWLCDRHNTVNKKLGKPIFDCSKVGERWRDGWKDGSCDE